MKQYILIPLFAILLFIGCSSSSDEKVPTVTTSDTNNSNENSNNSGNDDNSSLNINPQDEKEEPTIKPITDEETTTNQAPKTINMVINKVYQIEHGDSIIEIDKAEIRVVKNTEKDYFEATLLNGKANIQKKGNN